MYVCTAAERQYALEVWRQLDGGANLIPLAIRRQRIVNVAGAAVDAWVCGCGCLYVCGGGKLGKRGVLAHLQVCRQCIVSMAVSAANVFPAIHILWIVMWQAQSSKVYTKLAGAHINKVSVGLHHLFALDVHERSSHKESECRFAPVLRHLTCMSGAHT